MLFAIIRINSDKGKNMTTELVKDSGWTQQAKDYLIDQLTQAEVVLQYGCASSEIVCNESHVKTVLAVDANKAVCDEIYTLIDVKEKLHLMYADIGSLDESGKQPISVEHFKLYHQYMIFPWALADKYASMPDLVIIDGHFKVASFFYSLICAPENTKIIFNNFFDHPDHELIRNYSPLESRHGNAAVFLVRKNYIVSELTAMIAKYSVIPN